jgi:hypothetical protein
MPTIKEEEKVEKNISYEELRKSSMTQEQFEELTKVGEKMHDPNDHKKHVKWLNKQLIKEGLEDMEEMICDEPEIP